MPVGSRFQAVPSNAYAAPRGPTDSRRDSDIAATPRRPDALDSLTPGSSTFRTPVAEMRHNRPSAEEARRLLEASVKPLASTAQMTVVGERVSVTFKGVSADVLAQWLAQARLNAHAMPSEARLQRSATGTWDGTLVLSLQ